MNVRPSIPAALLTLAFVATPAVAAAQAPDWRVLTAAHQAGKADTLHVGLTFDAGTVQIGAASSPLLYDLRLRYDAHHARPMRRYDAATHTLTVLSDVSLGRDFTLDLKHGGLHVGNADDARGSDLALSLTRSVPLDLSLRLGACDATLDLSNLAVHRLSLHTGASESTVTFGTPNAVPLSVLDIAIGAASLTVHRLGNAHADSVRISARLGNADLDLAGDWTGTMRVDVTTTLASVVLHIPADVGIASTVSTSFGSLSSPTLAKRDGVGYSANWDTAKRRIVLSGRATLGNLSLTRE